MSFINRKSLSNKKGFKFQKTIEKDFTVKMHTDQQETRGTEDKNPCVIAPSSVYLHAIIVKLTIVWLWRKQA